MPSNSRKILVLFLAFSLALISKPKAQSIDTFKRVSQLIDSANLHLSKSAPSSALSFLLQATKLETSVEHNYALRQQLHLTTYRVLSEFNAHEQALEHIIIALEFEEKMGLVNTLSYFYKESEVGIVLIKLDDYNAALDAFNKALNTAKKIQNQRAIANSYNNIGYTFLLKNDFIPAESYLSKASKNFPLNKMVDSALMASIYDNLAILASHNNNIDSAISLRNSALKFMTNCSDNQCYKRLKFRISLANDLINTRKFNEAINVLLEVKTDMAFVPKSEKLRWDIEITSLHRKCLRSMNEHNKANVLATHELALREQLASENEIQIQQKDKEIGELELALVKYRFLNSELKENEQQIILKLKNEHARFLRTLTLLALCLIGLLGTSIYIFKRKRTIDPLDNQKIKELEIENQKLHQAQLEEQLANREQDLTEFALDNSRKREWLGKALQKIGNLDKTEDHLLRKAIKQLQFDLGNQLKIDDRVETFQKKVDTVNTDFYNKLKNKYEHLTKSELELCGLIMLGLSGKEIAGIRNIETRSVTRAKNRLRNKLGLEPNSDIKSNLDKI